MNNSVFLRANHAIICLLVLISFNKSSAQQFPTPNAAAIGISGEYPQSNFNGTPAINVLVYNFSYQGFSLPIQLNYNTNLVKPNMAGSWVGLGWNLTAGGAISRVVNGKPDDLMWFNHLDYDETQEYFMGYFYNHSYMTDTYSSLWTDSLRVKNAINDVLNYSPIYQYGQPYSGTPSATTIKDYSPDEFSFAVGDISGTFYMDDSGNWKVRCKNQVKVIMNNDDFASDPAYTIPSSPPMPLTGNRHLIRITLMDNRGIKFIFGGDASSIECVSSDYTTYGKTWYLTSVIFPNGKTIKYTYEKGQTVSYGYRYYQAGSIYNGGAISGGVSVGTVNQYQYPSYLKQIHTDLADIYFYRSEKAREYAKLDSIHICNPNDNNNLIKNYAFSYLNTPMDRLRLTGLIEKSGYVPIGPTYFFQYNTLQFNQVSTNADYWGYFTTKPLQTDNLTNFTQSRMADTANCRAELLDRVIYPTGGYTQYTWEANDYSRGVNDNRTTLYTLSSDSCAGGVRIKQINNYDKNSTRTGFKRFSYLKNFNISAPGNVSSGILYSKPTYTYSYQGYYTNNIYPDYPLIEDNTGSHISYSEVTETNADGSFVITDFSNFDTGTGNEYMDELASYNYGYGGIIGNFLIYSYNSNAHERGFPLLERQFSNTGTLLTDRAVQYIRVNKTNEWVKSYTGYLLPLTCSSCIYQYPAWTGSTVKIYTNAYLPSSETETVYNKNTGGANLTQTTKFTYDTSNLNVLSVTNFNSNGDSLQTVYKYPIDMVTLGDDATGVYAAMVDSNMNSAVIEKTTSKNNVRISFDRTNYFTTNNIIKPQYTQFIKGNGIEETGVNYQAYDLAGNLLSMNQQGGANTSYQWGYNKSLVVAKVKNAANSLQTVTSTATNSVSATMTNVSSYTTSFTFSLPNTETVDFEMDPTDFPGTNSKATVICSYTGASTGSFNLCVGVGSATCSNPSDTSVSLPAGNYTFNFSYQTVTNLQSGMQITASYDAPSTTTTGLSEFYFENFEESTASGVTTGAAHTGNKFMSNSSYTVNWALPNSRNYVISYWYHTGGIWKYSAPQNYTTGSFTLSGGDAYDDIRIYPKDAEMTTYTYIPPVGITSVTDAEGITTYYEYDSFQRLMNVKDKNGNIVKHIDYNYQR